MHSPAQGETGISAKRFLQVVVQAMIKGKLSEYSAKRTFSATPVRE